MSKEFNVKTIRYTNKRGLIRKRGPDMTLQLSPLNMYFDCPDKGNIFVEKGWIASCPVGAKYQLRVDD